MSKNTIFSVEVGSELRAEFIAATESVHRPASQVMRELMREFIQRQQEARAYQQFLQTNVDAGRASIRAGLGRSNEEVDAKFAALRG